MACGQCTQKQEVTKPPPPFSPLLTGPATTGTPFAMDRAWDQEGEAWTRQEEGKVMKRLVGILALAVIAVLLMGAALAAQRTGKQATPEKTNWPEKEEVNAIRPGHLTSQDPCASRSLFDLRSARPRAC